MSIALELFGAPRWWRDDGAAEELPLGQPLLLVSYLACRDDGVRRDELLALFWPDDDEKTARHNLSQLLYHCRKQPWIDGLEADRQRVRFVQESDVTAFRQALGDGDWATVVARYGGPLLAGMTPDDNPALQNWLEQQRQEFAGAWREAALAHAAALTEAGEAAAAGEVLEQVLAADPLAEEVVQAYLRLAAAAGRQPRALAAYRRFATRLRDELELDPLGDTQALAAALQASAAEPATASGSVPEAEGAPAAKSGAVEARAAPRVRGLPAFLTPFLGRETDLRALKDALQQPEVRLLTLIGPGGVGKTRLATELARQQAAVFADGAAFVDLAPLSRGELLAATILEVVAPTGVAGNDPTAALLQQLAGRELLLVLDNAEQLRSGLELLPEILRASPGSKIVVTSRRALELSSEQLVPLAGLRYPATPEAEQLDGHELDGHELDGYELDGYEAVQLFVRAARRRRPDLSFGATELAAAARICRNLDGLPLALELAASWSRLLSPSEIATELEQGLELLRGDHPDLPARQRSLEAVFASSWELLAADEREALKRLAVFRGGFTRAAATEVADVGLRQLLALTNASLLQRTPDGRFTRLVLVQQFSAEKLAAEPELAAALRRRHLAYYLAFAEEAVANLTSPEQVSWLERLVAEHDNLRLALEHALATDAESAVRLAGRLWPFWYTRGHYREGRDWLERALALPPSGPPSGTEAATAAERSRRSRALTGAGVFAEIGGDFAEAEVRYRGSLELCRAQGNSKGEAVTLNNLACLFARCGDLESAQRHADESLQIYQQLDDRRNVAASLGLLGQIARDRGDLPEARRILEEASRLSRQLGNRRQLAAALNNLGNVLQKLDQLEAAEAATRESLELNREQENQEGIAAALSNLGKLAFRRGELADAERLYRQCLAVCEATGDVTFIAGTQTLLGELALARNDAADAARYLQDAFATFQRMGLAHNLDEVLILVAELALAREQPELALTLAAAADVQAKAAAVVREAALTQRLEQLVERAGRALRPKQRQANAEAGQVLELDEVAALLEARIFAGADTRPASADHAGNAG